MKAKWMSWVMGVGLVGAAGLGMARLILTVTGPKTHGAAPLAVKSTSPRESSEAASASAVPQVPSEPLLKFEVELVVPPLQRSVPTARMDPAAVLASTNTPRLRPALLVPDETLPAGLAPTRFTSEEANDLLAKVGDWVSGGGQGLGIFVPKWTTSREILSPTAAVGGLGFGLSYRQSF